MSPYYHVEEELFHALHPFSLVTNAHGYITLLGRSLVKLFPQARLGAHYSQVCDILSPSGPGTPIDLAGLVGELIVLGVPGSNQPSARGQILQVFSPEHCFIFSLHPALNDTKRLVELRLDLSDFEMAAPLFDFLLVMRSMEVVNEKLRRANDSLQFDLAMSRVLREIITVLFRVEKTEDVYVKALNLVCAELKWDLAHVEYEVVDPQYSAPVDIWSGSEREDCAEFIELHKTARMNGRSDIAAKVIESGQIVWIAEYSAERGYPIAAKLPGGAGGVAVGVPIVINQRVVSVLEFFTTQSNHYSENSKEFFDLLSSQISLALSRIEAIRIERNQLAALAHASKMATLGQIVAGVAHEINNPVSTISLISQILKRMTTAGQVSQDMVLTQVGRIDSCVNRIAQIVSELRGFSRDTSRDPFAFESLRKIIDETIDLCHSCMSAHGVRLKLDVIPPDWLVPCRASQLSQVFMNLINNAYHAVDQSADKWVAIEVLEKERHYEVAVVDSGPGVPADIRDKIMTPFFTTKPAGKGTGLGLSISANIMIDHEGRLFLDESSPHTKFVVVIPKQRSKVT